MMRTLSTNAQIIFERFVLKNLGAGRALDPEALGHSRRPLTFRNSFGGGTYGLDSGCLEIVKPCHDAVTITGVRWSAKVGF